MYYTGSDLHKKTSFITTIDESGKIVFRRNFKNIEEHILDYFVNLDGPTEIVTEAMCSWHWLYDFFKGHNLSVAISNLKPSLILCPTCPKPFEDMQNQQIWILMRSKTA